MLGSAFPCVKVDLQSGFVVIRAPFDETQLLIVPTTPIPGIESPMLLHSDLPHFWSFAWNERYRVEAAAGSRLASDDIGLAVNSQPGRTQDQLHIHVDCIDPRLRRALADKPNAISARWSMLDLRPWASNYRVKSVAADELEQNLFRTVADEIPGAETQMALQSIAVIGLPDGNSEKQRIAILVNSEGRMAEELLDHTCSIAH